MEDNPPKVNKWDGNSVKNALDDAVKEVFLDKFKYDESHKLLDARLFISTVAVLFSLYALLWDFLYPFPKSREVMLICVFGYFITMALLTFYSGYVERSIFCTMLNKDQTGIEPTDTWYISSSMKRYDPVYHLSFEMKSGATGKCAEARLELPVEKFFDEAGTLAFQRVVKEVERLHSDLSKKSN